MPAIDPALVRLCAQNCAAANVRRASRAVTKLYGQFMAATGLEPTQYSLLVACALTGGGVKCWGANDYGQLGLGDWVNRGDDPARWFPSRDWHASKTTWINWPTE